MKKLFQISSAQFTLNVPDWLSAALLTGVGLFLEFVIQSASTHYTEAYPTNAGIIAAITAGALRLVYAFFKRPTVVACNHPDHQAKS